MRTTVTLDPDTEALLRRRMRERRISFKEALNEAVRIGCGMARTGEHVRPFRQKTYRMGFRPEFRWDKALALAEAIEDEELVRKLELRK
jgi:hypothetical protein